MPTRQEMDLTRIAIDRGFLTVAESVECLKIQRDYDQAGRPVALETIYLDRKLLTEAQLATLRESLARAAALRRIGHYEILSKVGAGGMGTVYRAKDLNADRIVALKVLSPGHAANKDYIERFLREAKAVGQLNHPNIVQGYDAGEAGGQYYFAMEFIDGTTVGEILREGRAIPEQQALDIAIQVAKALEHAEQHALVHQDIKPDNIMITKDGTAKLADLGLAKLATGDAAGRDRRNFGTAYYAAPEQCEGDEEVDSKSDMYAFGATLFHMLAGRVPFDGESPAEVMSKHVQEKPPYLKDINVQLSHGVSKIVRKLLSKYKRDRYPAMSEVVRDLTLVRMGRSPKLGERSRHDSGEYRYRSSTGIWRTKRPNRRKVFLQVSLCAALGAVIIAAAYFLFQFVKPRPRGPGPGARRAAATEPAGTARPAHQIYLEEQVLAKRDRIPREDYLKLLQSVAEKYKGTESATKAEAEAGTVLRAMESEAEPLFNECRTAALSLRDESRFQAALERIDRFPAEYRPTRFAAELAALRKTIREGADAEFRRVKARAAALAAANKFSDAAAAYRVVIDTCGIPEWTTEATEAIRKLKQAEEEESKRTASDEKQREKDEEIRKDGEALRAGAKEVAELVARARYDDARDKAQAFSQRLTLEENKAAMARAAADLEQLGHVLDLLKQAGTELKGKAATITCRDGTRIEGTIFGAGPTRISIECIVKDAKAIRSVLWDDLSAESVKTLTELKVAGKWASGQRTALAALLFFSGKHEDAKVQLAALAADPDQKKAAEERLADFGRFGGE